MSNQRHPSEQQLPKINAQGAALAAPESNTPRPRFKKSARASKRDIIEKAIKIFFAFNGYLTIAVLGMILYFLLRESWPAIQEVGLWTMVTGQRWNPTSPQLVGYGMAPLILSSIMVTVGSLAIAIPWGIAVAAYIADVASPRFKEILKPVVETLAIFPSVVIGFIALVAVAPFLANLFGMSSGLVALTGCLALAVMALPTIVSVSEDAITAVSRDYREAAYALGATKWQTVRHVVLPAAKSGIIAAVMLGFGRAIGETMTVVMATGNATTMPVREMFGGLLVFPDFLASIRTLTATIAQEGLNVAWGSMHWHVLFVAAAILFFMTFVVNLIADLILHRHIEQGREGV